MTEQTPRPRRPEDFLQLELEKPASGWAAKRSPILISILGHVAAFVLLAIPATRKAILGEPLTPSEILIRFYQAAGEGPGGGGGGGGSGGRHPTAYIRTRFEPDPETSSEPRKAPVAPRRLPPLNLNADTLKVPDLPTDTDMLFGGVFSPDAAEFPGLSLLDSKDYGGIDREPSSGTGGGIGGGRGTGVGTGEGWGVGPGTGGGFGGGDYKPRAVDINPILLYEPPEPPYPPMAREKLVQGEVILEILIRVNGTTEVLRVLKSLPYCVDTAVEQARKYRWKPALIRGKPVEHVGILTVTFELYSGRVRSG